MRLDAYLAEQNISDAEFADRVGVERQTVYRWKRGERFPDKLLLRRIAEATDGAVTPNDFFDVSEGSHEDGEAA